MNVRKILEPLTSHHTDYNLVVAISICVRHVIKHMLQTCLNQPLKLYSKAPFL